jgi:RNA polymerase sigma factor (sigma-70 family)
MATGQACTVLRHLRGLVVTQGTRDQGDAQLLERFATHHDEAAFATLVQRYGRLVWSVCRHVLRHEQDAEDAFQATFLVLARKPNTVRKGDALAAFLHGTAYRVALRARRDAAIRRVHERRGETMPAEKSLPESVLREALALLDEEVERLPTRQRAAFVLCSLEGKTLAEAARQLGWKEGTVSGTLSRARQHLRRRLSHRGVTLTALLAATVLGRSAAAMPTGLARATVAAVAQHAAGERVRSMAGALADAVLRGVVVARARTITALLLAGCVVLAGAGWLAPCSPGDTPGAAAVPARSPDTQRVDRTDASGDPLPPGALARLGTTRLRHGGRIYSLALSPDGRTLASRGLDGRICLWQLASGKEVACFRLAAAGDWNDTVAFSPDGKYLATATGEPGGTSHVGILEIATGRKALRIRVRDGKVTAVAFAPDGQTLAGACGKTVRLWDARTGRQLRELRGHQDEIELIAFSPDGKLLASGSRDKTVRLWDPATGRAVRPLEGKLSLAPDFDRGIPGFPKMQQRGVVALAFSPDGQRLAAVASDPTFRLWDGTTGKELPPFKQGPREATAVAFLPDGKSLVCGAWDGTVSVCDLVGGTVVRRFQAQAGPVLSLVLTPDGKTLAVGGERSIRLWHVATGREIGSQPGPYQGVYRVAFAPDGQTIATGSGGADHKLSLWNAATGKELHALDAPDGDTDMLRFSPDGKALLAGLSWSPTVYFWFTDSGQVRGNTGLGRGCRFIPSSERWLLAGMDNSETVYQWDALSGMEVARTRAPHWSGGAVSPDGKRVATDSPDKTGTIIIRDAQTGMEVCRCPGHDRSLSAGPVFSPDGRYLAAAYHTLPRVCVVWDAATGAKVCECVGSAENGEAFATLAFAPDGRSLASGGWDQAVHIWEVSTGRQRRSFHGHLGQVLSLAYSADGTRLVSGSADTTGLVWDVRGLEPARQEQRTVRQVRQAWDDLASGDAALADRAATLLIAAGGPGAAALGTHLQPVIAPPPGRLARLVTDLDSERFEVRQKASQELEALGEIAAPALRRARGSLELRRRAEDILGRLRPGASPERLRQLRAIEVLEMLATPEARHILERLAGGAPEALPTREARASLDRLARR